MSDRTFKFNMSFPTIVKNLRSIARKCDRDRLQKVKSLTNPNLSQFFPTIQTPFLYRCNYIGKFCKLLFLSVNFRHRNISKTQNSYNELQHPSKYLALYKFWRFNQPKTKPPQIPPLVPLGIIIILY
jgi:hypothetical protein